MSKSSLRGRSWRRLAPELYCWKGLRMDPWLLVTGWSRRLPRDAVLTGRTAAWLFGIDVDPTPIEVIVPPTSGLRSRPGLEVHRCDVADVMSVRGLRVTTIERTLAEACRRLSEVEALVLWDAAVRLRLIERTGLAEPAESPMETRLRWLLIQAGLPRPEVQTNLHDASGRFVGRADLYYPVARLVIEFDGSNHRDRLVEDNRRQNALLNAGFELLRFTAADLSQRPEGIVAQVRGAL
ncbi:MAG TPA: DUF559 domain-containing protein [Candidatus Dormibacteraeota bacterium]|nr:DUF559 domain-containing protein [Candidatus Dormibacteraeota bacterium]